jgi:hypothetical protein
MIIILNSPEVALLIKRFFSDFNPDTPFDPKALTEEQREAIGFFIKVGLIGGLTDEEDKDIAETYSVTWVMPEDDDVDRYMLYREHFESCDDVKFVIEHSSSFFIEGVDLLGMLSNVVVSPGATSLWLHFDN